MEFPLLTNSYPVLFLKIKAGELDKHHVIQKKRRKNFTWENPKKTDDFGGSKRHNGRKILISIKVDFKIILYESG